MRVPAQSGLPVTLEQMASDEQEFDLSMPAVVDKYKSAGAVANGTKSSGIRSSATGDFPACSPGSCSEISVFEQSGFVRM